MLHLDHLEIRVNLAMMENKGHLVNKALKVLRGIRGTRVIEVHLVITVMMDSDYSVALHHHRPH
jgi:hypothetical protein